MMPIGPLMIEHRLIEKIIPIILKEKQKISKNGNINPIFVDKIVDFFRMYADRTHHGKEEDILFRDLRENNLSIEHKQKMKELEEEHIWARKKVSSLVEAKERYMKGVDSGVSEILEILDELATFYPKHIKKEDTEFFIPVMKYFNEIEQKRMLQEFGEFDKGLIHEKYQRVIDDLNLEMK